MRLLGPNIGSSRPIGLEDFIATVETAVGQKALRHGLPAQPGEMRRPGRALRSSNGSLDLDQLRRSTTA